MKNLKNNLLLILLGCITVISCSSKKEQTVTNIVEVSHLTLQIGDTIPSVLGVNEDSILIKSSDYAGSKLVLYFYPKDETPGCTTQACDLRDNYDVLLSKGYKALGVSTDDVVSHKNFRINHNLPFSLIADVNGELSHKFGAIREGRPIRITFLIDENGVIREVIEPENIDVKNHAIQILEYGKN